MFTFSEPDKVQSRRLPTYPLLDVAAVSVPLHLPNWEFQCFVVFPVTWSISSDIRERGGFENESMIFVYFDMEMV